MIDEVKTQLEKLYSETLTAEASRLGYIRALTSYISYTKTEPLLVNLITSLREEEARKAITDIRKSLVDPVYKLLVRAQEEVGETPELFPFGDYEYLLEAEEDFARWKSVKNEEELAAQRVEVRKETESGWISGTHTGAGLLLYADKVYPKQIKNVHEYLLKRLSDVKERGYLSKHLAYEEGILYFQEKEIRINNRKLPSNSHYLLSYLFSNNPFDQHFYDELEEEKVLLQERSWKSYYDACSDIRKKVETAIGVSDFLDFSTGKGMYVRINPKYSLETDT